MHDSRLVGTWRSDRRLTERDIAARRDISAKARRTLVSMFGHLTLRYTRTRCYSDFRGEKESWPYRVLAKTSDSVAIIGDYSEEPLLRHLHFDALDPRPRVYWICLGSFREFFRRT